MKHSTFIALLLGVMLGQAYAIACGSGVAKDSPSALDPAALIPGVGVAMAQANLNCARWQFKLAFASDLEEPETRVFNVPEGWTPAYSINDAHVLLRCAP